MIISSKNYELDVKEYNCFLYQCYLLSIPNTRYSLSITTHDNRSFKSDVNDYADRGTDLDDHLQYFKNKSF